MDEIFGLPTHPLIVHAAVVLLPLSAIGVVATALFTGTRKVLAPIVLGLAVVSLASVFVAEESGESLDRRLDEGEEIEEHEEAAEWVLPWAFLVTVGAAGVTFVEPIRRLLGNRVSAKTATGALVAFGLVAGAGATAAIIATGHTGAEAVWQEKYDGETEGGETTPDDHGTPPPTDQDDDD